MIWVSVVLVGIWMPMHSWCVCVGEFTRFYPNGRGVTKSLGGRDKAMGFINHSNPDIQRHALQCVSKLMISNWDHLR